VRSPRGEVRPAARVLLLLALLAAFVVGCSDEPAGEGRAVEDPPATGAATLTFREVTRHPHDPDAFTQGFLFLDESTIAESVGGYGSSEVRLVDAETGAVRARAAVPPDRFAEGLALHRGEVDELIQLTWKEGVAMRWSATDLRLLGELSYEGEGWGLAEDPETGQLYFTDGSAVITRRDPTTLAQDRAITVHRDGQPVDQLNEIEWVDGVLWANVWRSDELLRIDPATGDVTGVLDASSLNPHLDDPEAVLNGIAHRPGDPPTRLWVTGKRWPEVIVIDVVEGS
jgi:glutamine cyclotransferase